MKKILVIGFVLMLCVVLVSCTSSFDISGMWMDVDGTVRTFDSNGACQNIAKIDIGGSLPTYTLSEKEDSNGYYLLFVQQGGYNQTNFFVKTISNDSIEVYEKISSEKPLYTLTRQ